MKRKISILLTILILLVTCFATSSFANEATIDEIPELIREAEGTETIQNIEDGEVEIVSQDIFELHNEDYVMDKLIDGNAFIMVNGDVNISGEINGSAYILANGKVTIEEEAIIYDSLYVMARKVVIKGLAYDVYAMTENFETTDTAYISRDTNLMANSVKLRGELKRNASIEAQSINVKDEKSKLTITGDFSYTSPNEIEGLNEVVTIGEIHYTKYVEEEIKDTPVVANKLSNFVSNAISSMIYVLIVYLIIRFAAPKFSERIGKDLKEKSIVDFAIGLLSYVFVVIIIVASLILLFTLIGAPISILVWMLLILGIFISPAVFQIAVLELIADKHQKIKDNIGFSILTLLGISASISLLELIPYVGGIVGFITVTVGLGLLVRNVIEKKEKIEKV